MKICEARDYREEAAVFLTTQLCYHVRTVCSFAWMEILSVVALLCGRKQHPHLVSCVNSSFIGLIRQRTSPEITFKLYFVTMRRYTLRPRGVPNVTSEIAKKSRRLVCSAFISVSETRMFVLPLATPIKDTVYCGKSKCGISGSVFRAENGF